MRYNAENIAQNAQKPTISIYKYFSWDVAWRMPHPTPVAELSKK